MGGKVNLLLCGAAPLAPHVEEFLRVVMCCHVLQGYGMKSFTGYQLHA
jgi:long-chain acyl-CoA synthetase